MPPRRKATAKAAPAPKAPKVTKEAPKETAAPASKPGRKRRISSPAPAAAAPSKRGRPSGVPKPEKKVTKNAFRQTRTGVTLSLGQGDTGQLGLGEDIMERSKPALVKELENVVDIASGGMHSLALTKDGKVLSYGCNDEGSLGRITEDDDECYTPAEVAIEGKVVMISAGDSHSVALTEDGRAFYWGTFRDSSGSFGLTSRGIEKLPVALAPGLTITKIASGADHVALLTDSGDIYTLGCAEQGQLGRVGERFTARGGRRGLALLHTPDKIHTKARRTVFANVWAGSYSTYAQTEAGQMLVCGLNNYNQLGVEQGQLFYTLVPSPGFTGKTWRAIVPGQHHAVALDDAGKVFTIGRVEYGRLGLGEKAKEDAKVPTAVPALEKTKVVDVGAGTAVSFAVTEAGDVFSWGMGTNGQLGLSDDDDAWEPKKMLGKQLETRKVVLATGGGQHTQLLAV